MTAGEEEAAKEAKEGAGAARAGVVGSVSSGQWRSE
jgi:hypothetical protein